MAKKSKKSHDQTCSQCGHRGPTVIPVLPSPNAYLSLEERKKPRKYEYTCAGCRNKTHEPKQEEVTPTWEHKISELEAHPVPVSTPSLFRRILHWFLRLFGFSRA